VGDSGGGNLAAAAAAAPLQLSSLPRRRLSEWPAKPVACEDGGDHHRSGAGESMVEVGRKDVGIEAGCRRADDGDKRRWRQGREKIGGGV
jgi:hypothetical protein